MLTYERLLARTSTLLDMAANEIEGDRRRLLQTAMNSLIISAELGLEGDQEVLSPDQLKHWFEWDIKAIHEPFDGPVQGEDTPVPKRRMIAQTAASASHKQQRKNRTSSPHFSSLLALRTPSPRMKALPRVALRKAEIPTLPFPLSIESAVLKKLSSPAYNTHCGTLQLFGMAFLMRRTFGNT